MNKQDELKYDGLKEKLRDGMRDRKREAVDILVDPADSRRAIFVKAAGGWYRRINDTSAKIPLEGGGFFALYAEIALLLHETGTPDLFTYVREGLSNEDLMDAYHQYESDLARYVSENESALLATLLTAMTTTLEKLETS